MARQRTGTLEYRQGKGFFLRVSIDVVKDGVPTTDRPWIDLETHDKARAVRMQKKIVAEIQAGRVVAEARTDVKAPATVKDEADDYVTRRKAANVRMAPDEESYLRHHVIPVIGHMVPSDVRAPDVRRVLDTAIASGLAKGSVSHVRRVMHRLFGDMYRAERLPENPVGRVRMQDLQIREVKKKRVVPTDEEIAIYLTHSAGDIELKMLSLSARVVGGMRTVETIRWTWQDIDLESFATCWIPRAKGSDPQQLDVPEMLRPFLHAWWTGQGKPTAGPVFPSRRGKRKGLHKSERGASFAKRLRRDLLKCGITRHELHNDTARTRQCDFHSFRRAFASALARTNTNAQQSMALTNHTDMRTHNRYLVDQFTAVPVAALPAINGDTGPILSRLMDDSRKRAPKALVFARHGGFEPPTYGSGGDLSNAERACLTERDAVCDVGGPSQGAPRLHGHYDDSSPADDTSDDDGCAIDGRAVHPLIAVFAALQ